MHEPEIEKLFSTENEQLKKLHQIVSEAIKEEELIVTNLLHPPHETLTRGQLISDKVARFGGSWMFIISFGIVLLVWIAVNVLVPEQKKFDPYPFILMNLVLSTIAALQAPIIMMSQNRKEDKDRMRAQNDYLINLKAELEIKNLQLNMKNLFEIQKKQIELLDEIRMKK